MEYTTGAIKTMKLSSLPEVLCIHVGRPPYVSNVLATQ